MKLRIGDKVYLQKYEVAHIMHDVDYFPTSILRETFGVACGGIFFMNSITDSFRFDCVFKEPENVKWLMDQDWIVNYDDYAEMPLEELEAFSKYLETKYFDEIDVFNAEDETYREAHFDEASDGFDKLEHKIASLKLIVGYRKGDVKLIFPDEYQDKANISSGSNITSTTIPRKKPGFFARLFGRGSH